MGGWMDGVQYKASMRTYDKHPYALSCLADNIKTLRVQTGFVTCSHARGHGLKTKGRETRVPAGGSDCRGLQRTHVTSEESATDRHVHTWQRMTACIWQQKLHFREPFFSWVKTVVCNLLFYSLAAFTKDCSQREVLVTCVWFNFLELTNTDIWGKVTEGKFEIKCGDTKNSP